MLIKKNALNKHACLLTRLYGIISMPNIWKKYGIARSTYTLVIFKRSHGSITCLTIESLSRSNEGRGGQQMLLELLNKEFHGYAAYCIQLSLCIQLRKQEYKATWGDFMLVCEIKETTEKYCKGNVSVAY